MVSTDLQEIEQNIKDAEEFVKAGEAIGRLMVNRDFKRVVLNGYFKDEAVRLVHLKGITNVQSEGAQKYIDDQIKAISLFAQYLDNVASQAEMAKAGISEAEDLRLELVNSEQ